MIIVVLPEVERDESTKGVVLAAFRVHPRAIGNWDGNWGQTGRFPLVCGRVPDPLIWMGPGLEPASGISVPEQPSLPAGANLEAALVAESCQNTDSIRPTYFT
jgi:hypothetical protein